MSGMRKFIVVVGQQLAFLILPFALPLVAQADAQPAQVAELEPSRAELLAKIRWLENRVQVLETRIQELERPSEDKNPKPVNASVNRVLVAPAPARANAGYCVPPYTIDPQGLRHFIPDCLGSPSVAPCEPPFTIDTTGIKRVKQGCLTQ